MEQYKAALEALYDRIPRRHSADNVKEINNLLDDYEAILSKIEGLNSWYEKNTAVFYPSLETIRNTIKMSNSNKASKKAKDDLFDEASGSLKDDIQSLVNIYGDGSKTG